MTKVVDIQDKINLKRSGGNLPIPRKEKENITFELMTKRFNTVVHPGSKHDSFLQAHHQLMEGFMSSKATLDTGHIIDTRTLNNSRKTHHSHNNRLKGVDNSSSTSAIAPGMISRLQPISSPIPVSPRDQEKPAPITPRPLGSTVDNPVQLFDSEEQLLTSTPSELMYERMLHFSERNSGVLQEVYNVDTATVELPNSTKKTFEEKIYGVGQ